MLVALTGLFGAVVVFSVAYQYFPHLTALVTAFVIMTVIFSTGRK